MKSPCYLHTVFLPGNEDEPAVTINVHSDILQFIRAVVGECIFAVEVDRDGLELSTLYVCFFDKDKGKGKFIVGNYKAFAAERNLTLVAEPQYITNPLF